MTRNRLLFFVLSIAVLVPIIATTFMAAAARDDSGEDSFYKYLTVFTEVLSRVRSGYVEEPELDGLIVGALDGAADALDPFSFYVPPDGVDPFLTAREVGNRNSGILVLKEQGVLYVVGVQPGSPADEAGIEVGDVVVEINSEPTRTMPLFEAQRIFSGPAGTQLELQLLRQREQVTASFELRRFEPPHASFRTEDEVAVVRIPSFEESIFGEARKAIADAAGKQRMLLDLRGVAGGDPEIAYRIAGLLVTGELGYLTRRQEKLATFDSQDAPLWSGELAVLVDRGTLGPAELLAAVLQQRLDAPLVGERTFGYAGRQELVELSNGGRLVITRSFYSGPDAEPLQESLQPDHRPDRRFAILESDEEEGEEKDVILDLGLSVIRGEVAADSEERQAA